MTRKKHDAAAGDQDDPTEQVRKLRTRLRRARADTDALRDLLTGASGLPDHVVQTIASVLRDDPTMIRPFKLIETAKVVHELASSDVEGDYLETGTARGGSGIVIASAKPPAADLFVHDVFGMIPAPTAADGEEVRRRYETIASGEASGIGESVYYGYEDDLLSQVRQAYERCGLPVDEHRVHLVQGLFEETVHPRGPVAFAHLDGDWYESTKVVIERVLPHLVVGGVLVIDDYNAWSGCRKAVDELLTPRSDMRRVDANGVRFVRTA